MSYQLKVCSDRKEKVVQQDTAVAGAARQTRWMWFGSAAADMWLVIKNPSENKIDTIRIRRSLSYIF